MAPIYQSDDDTQGRLFCEIYVQSEEGENAFIEHVCALLSGSRSGNEVRTEWAVVQVFENDFAGKKFEDPKDSFLGYRYKIEFEFGSEMQIFREDYITNAGSLLTQLWDNGYKAVASCCFEEELPQNGGYKIM